MAYTTVNLSASQLETDGSVSFDLTATGNAGEPQRMYRLRINRDAPLTTEEVKAEARAYLARLNANLQTTAIPSGPIDVTPVTPDPQQAALLTFADQYRSLLNGLKGQQIGVVDALDPVVANLKTQCTNTFQSASNARKQVLLRVMNSLG